MRRWAAVAVAALLIVLVLVIAFVLAPARRPPAGPGPQLARAAAEAPSAAHSFASGPSPSAPGASVAARAASRVDPAPTRRLSARAERMRADWCGYGAAAHERETEAILKRIEASQGAVGDAALAELNATDGSQVLTEAREQVRRRWVQALRQRGDPRSLALAEFLGPGDEAPADEVAAANRRLQALARSSTDPMLTALALLRPCAAGGCVNVEASQWSRLEPQNLQAWLAWLKAAPDRESALDHALDRMAAQGQFSNTYEREATQLLLSLPHAEGPGLQAEAELQYLTTVAASWPIGNVSPIIRACRESPPPAGRLERCEAVARVFWREGDRIERGIAIGLARAVVSVEPDRREAWQQPAREFGAVQAWMQREQARWQAQAAGEVGASPCAGQQGLHRQLRELRAEGEWAYALRGMRAAGVDDEMLAAEWQRQSGRGALDPVRPASVASAASR